MTEEELKQIWDNLFNKLNETEKIYLAIVSNEKNKEIERLKEELEKLNVELRRYKSIVYLCEKVKDSDKE